MLTGDGDANSNIIAGLSQFLRAKLATKHKLMSESHGIKGGATDEAFQEQWCLWERGASVAGDVDLFDFQDLSIEVYLNHKFAPLLSVVIFRVTFPF